MRHRLGRDVYGDDDCGEIGHRHLHRAALHSHGQPRGDGERHGDLESAGDQLRSNVLGRLRQRNGGDAGGDAGSLKWRAPSGNRVWPGIAVADLTGDGTLEVVVARDSDQLTVYNRFGNVVWTRNPFSGGELRTLAVTDLETGGQLEIMVGQAAGLTPRQLNVLAPNGTLRPGWPARHDGEPGDSFGMWKQNVTVADMNGHGFNELFVPRGHYIHAFDPDRN